MSELDDETWTIGSLLMIDDVTEQERLRESVHLNDKLESIGLLAAGVAHEINNPLEIILSNVEYLESLYRDRLDMEILKEISEEISAVSEIVGTLSIVGQESRNEAELINVKSVVKSLINLLRNYSLEKGITIRFRAGPETMMIRAPRGELRQIMINLIKNSSEAVSGGGTIEVELARHGDRVRMFVIDSGPGIDPDARKSIFLPFFTTKRHDAKKRGLGLYMVYELVKKNAGRISINTDSKSGCRIDLDFPTKAISLHESIWCGAGKRGKRIYKGFDEQRIKLSFKQRILIATQVSFVNLFHVFLSSKILKIAIR